MRQPQCSRLAATRAPRALALALALAGLSTLWLAGCTRHHPTPTPDPAADPLPASAAPPPARTAQPQVLFDQPSPYGRVIVVDTGSRRCLKFSMDGGDQSCVDLRAPKRLVHEYVRFLSVGLLFVPRTPRVLMLGLGGGRAVRMFLDADPGLQLDVVEINPTVVQVARQYFDIEPSERLRIHVADGREFFADRTDRWHLIVLDAFGNDYIPFHLTTEEFLRVVAAHVEDDGAVVANLWTRNDRLFRAMVKTYAHVFPTIRTFRAVRARNAIVVASGQQPAATCEQVRQRAEIRGPELTFSFDFDVPSGRCQSVRTLKLDDVPVLRDGARKQFEALGRL
jgi:spermidine synthase